MNVNIETIKQLACQFRKALEAVSKEKLYGRLHLMSSFPTGFCGYASDLLATYLIDNGIPPKHIQVVKGKTKQAGYTHVWLMIDDVFFLDITADQYNGKPFFEKYAPIPTCCFVPRNTYLYECFDERETQFFHNVGIDTYSEDVFTKLQVVYNAAVQQIDRN